ncbi:hypothetical protein [Ruminococcus sp.]
MAKISRKMRAASLLYHLIKVLALGQGYPEKEKKYAIRGEDYKGW